MFLNISISSNNLYSLNLFLKIFLKMLNSNNLILNSFCDVKTVFNKKKVFTVLKSPHVNKTAQEQYKTELFTSKILIKSNQIRKLLVFIKYINKNLFSDVNLKFKIYLNNKNLINTQLKQLDPNNYRVNFCHKRSDFILKCYLDILSNYGEMSFKNNSLV